jgi:hypothetical protein
VLLLPFPLLFEDSVDFSGVCLVLYQYLFHALDLFLCKINYNL